MPRPVTPSEARQNQLSAVRPPWDAKAVAHMLEAHFAVDELKDVTTNRPELQWVARITLDDGQRYYVTVEKDLSHSPAASVYERHTGA